jgi:O-antigen biosynthesis protein WbqP
MKMKRIVDLFLCILALVFFSIPLIFIYFSIKLTSKGPALYYSKRVGQNNKIFLMPKFRSMRIDTPQVATHLLSNPEQYLTPIGRFIRKTSLDELPQLFSVLKGDMSFVGPRPALFNQDNLIQLRTNAGIDKLTPGITGWAQINGRDEIPISKKVELDRFYLEHSSALLDIKIIFLTALKVLRKEGITH